MHFVSIIITSVQPQLISHYIPEFGDPCPKIKEDFEVEKSFKHLASAAPRPTADSELEWKLADLGKLMFFVVVLLERL